MKDHYELSDEEFEKQFEECSLAPSLFSHEAHLRLAWIHIQKYGLAQAEDNLCMQIKRYATHLGAAGKFHMTVTIAAIKAVNHFIKRSESKNFEGLIAEFPRLKTNFMDLMNAHYGENIFKNEKARTAFIAPDLTQFD